jgi:hypothetical protein
MQGRAIGRCRDCTCRSSRQRCSRSWLPWAGSWVPRGRSCPPRRFRRCSRRSRRNCRSLRPGRRCSHRRRAPPRSSQRCSSSRSGTRRTSRRSCRRHTRCRRSSTVFSAGQAGFTGCGVAAAIAAERGELDRLGGRAIGVAVGQALARAVEERVANAERARAQAPAGSVRLARAAAGAAGGDLRHVGAQVTYLHRGGAISAVAAVTVAELAVIVVPPAPGGAIGLDRAARLATAAEATDAAHLARLAGSPTRAAALRDVTQVQAHHRVVARRAEGEGLAVADGLLVGGGQVPVADPGATV